MSETTNTGYAHPMLKLCLVGITVNRLRTPSKAMSAAQVPKVVFERVALWVRGWR